MFDNYAVTIMIGDDPVILGMFDTAGQEDYDRLRPLSYPETDVVIIGFRVDSPHSLETIPEMWMPEIRHHLPDVPVIVVAMQEDLRSNAEALEKLRSWGQKPITYDDGLRVAKSIGADAYAECSALTQVGLKDAFDGAIELGLSVRQRASRALRRKNRECVLM